MGYLDTETVAAAEDYAAGVEQTLLGYALMEPAWADEVLRLTAETDYSHAVHQTTYAVIAALRAERRVPQVGLVADAVGNDEVYGGIRTGGYLRQCIDVAQSGFYGNTLPGLAEALRDHANRRDLAHIGGALANAAVVGRNLVGDVIRTASEGLDAVAVRLRASKPRHYTAAGAASAALEHMDGTGDGWPSTGLQDLDRMLGGWPRGQLTILAGRTGMGKTAFALSSMVRGAKAGHASGMVSLEMSKEQLGARILTDLAYTRDSPIYYDEILKRKVDADDTRRRRRLLEAQTLLGNLPITIHQQRGLTLSEVTAQARKMAAEYDRQGRVLETLYVDHIGLIRYTGRADTRHRQLAEISDGLATLADELGISIVGLAQLNRGVEGRENRRPSLADLKESGALEEDARAVVFCFRPAYYLQKKEDVPQLEEARVAKLQEKQNVLELLVAKNSNGPTGTVEAWCDIGANVIRGLGYGR